MKTDALFLTLQMEHNYKRMKSITGQMSVNKTWRTDLSMQQIMQQFHKYS